MNNKVSIRRVIGNVAAKLRLTDVSSTISFFADWAVEAEMKIGSRSSYESFECELEVKNYRACLPAGFVRLKEVRQGNNVLDVTMKNFVEFHKGIELQPPKDSKFMDGGQLKPNNPGQPNVWQINFVPLFQAGDVISIAVSNDNCGDVTINNFTYVVQPGDNIPDILAEFVNQINTIGGLPYTAVPDSSFIQLIAVNNLINMQVTVTTDSITGSVNTELIARRILPTVHENQAHDNCDVDIKQGSENLANRQAALLNDGLTAEAADQYGSDFYGYGLNDSPNVSKFALQNGYIHFNAIKEGKIGISYYGIAVDEEGWPLIDEKHVDAVTQYLMWQYDIADWRENKRAAGYMRWVETRWYTLCAQARGNDEMPDQQEMKYLANQYMQLIPLPNKNHF
jgi:hypothetical protein